MERLTPRHGQWAPRDEDVRQEVLLGEEGRSGVMGYLQSLVGTAPGSLIGTVLQSGSRFPGRRTRPSPPAITSRPTQGGGGVRMSASANPSSLGETES